MKLFLDIETIPDQTAGAIDRYMGDEIRCPHKSKVDIGKDLGMKPEDYKFIGADDFKQLWIERKGKEAAKVQAEQKWLKTSLDGSYGQIICIGYCLERASGASESGVLSIDNYESEKELLEAFWSIEFYGRTPQLIAHNTGFDLPFIWHRSVINGTSPSIKFDPWARQGEKRYCTMEAWAGFKGMISLDNLASILGVQGKSMGMSGKDVWPEYKAGNIAKISEYCADDVRVLKEVYNKLNFV